MRYKVLWIDDDFKTQQDFIGEAEQEGIDILAFESHEEGMAELNKRLEYYHAVILDAKVKERKEDTVTGLSGLMASRDRLIEINKNSYLPYFIFTGQPDYTNSTLFNEVYGKYYIKASDNESLFTDLKAAIEKKEEYLVRKKYRDVFEVCSEKYVGDHAAQYLSDILCNIERKNDLFNNEKYFTGLRKVIELIFRASNKIGLLDNKCIPNGVVNLTWASLYMSGKVAELKPGNEKIHCSKAHFPVLISKNVKYILDIANAASHTEGPDPESDKLGLSEYKGQINSNYLLYSITFQLMDILLWYKAYADANPRIEANKKLWLSDASPDPGNEWVKGVVFKVSVNGWGSFKQMDDDKIISIPPQMVTNNKLREGDKIEMAVYPDSTGTKLYVSKIKKL
ncbi:MAG: hypothetical protein U0T79_11200 [Ferruginibacter sp.]